MKLAVHCANLTWPGGPGALAGTLSEVATTADEGGVSTLTIMDHWCQMEQTGGPSEPMLEAYTSSGSACTHYRLAEAVNVPAPLQPYGHRILVGGSVARLCEEILPRLQEIGPTSLLG